MADGQDTFKDLTNTGAVTSSLGNLTPEQVDSLVSTARISKAQADELKARAKGQATRDYQNLEEDASIALQKAQNPAQYAQDAQQAADTVEGMAMQDTGVAPGFSPLTPAPSPVGQQTFGLPSTLETPAGDVAAVETAAALQQEAKVGAQRAVDAQRAKQSVDTQQHIEQRNKKVEEGVKNDLDRSNSPLMRNIADGIAIGLGAYAQHLLGSKENPGVQAIERRLEKEAADRKYGAEQESALRKMAVDAANLRLEQMKMATDNAYKIAQITKMQAEVGKLRGDAVAGQNLTALISNPVLNRAQVLELQTMGDEGRKLSDIMVPMPYQPDQFVRAIGNTESVSNLKKYMNDVGSIIPEIDSILNQAKSPEFSKLLPEERARMGTKLVALVGKLRLPFTGPGAMVETEYQRLANTIGDPRKLASLESWQTGKLEEVRSIITGNIKNAYKHLGGIDLPENSLDVQTARLQNKGVSPEMAKRARESLARRKQK